MPHTRRTGLSHTFVREPGTLSYTPVSLKCEKRDSPIRLTKTMQTWVQISPFSIPKQHTAPTPRAHRHPRPRQAPQRPQGPGPVASANSAPRSHVPPEFFLLFFSVVKDSQGSFLVKKIIGKTCFFRRISLSLLFFWGSCCLVERCELVCFFLSLRPMRVWRARWRALCGSTATRRAPLADSRRFRAETIRRAKVFQLKKKKRRRRFEKVRKDFLKKESLQLES